MDTHGSSSLRAPEDLRVLLHVGVPKTATTAIQTCLAASRPELLERGVLYPGRKPNQHAAIRRLITALDADPDESPDTTAWNRIARAVRRHDGRSCVSDEFAAVASPRAARRIVEDLGGDGVHVVITLRPLEQLLPSMWQEDLKHGVTTALGPWLDDVARGPRPERGDAHLFWYVHDHLNVARNWLSAVTPDRLHLVVVDRARPDDVFDTFSRLLGLPAGFLDPRSSTRANRSLSMPEAEALRGLVLRLTRTGPLSPDTVRHLRAGINHMVENRRPGDDETRIGVPVRHVLAIRHESQRIVEGLARLGVDVVGDLASLCPTHEPVDAELADVTSMSLDAAVLLLEGLTLARLHRDESPVGPPEAPAPT